MDDLINATPPYINEDYTSGARQGYNFTCGTFEDTGYECTATPSNCGTTGTKVYTITTGAVLNSTDCT
jgi:hypothetical protein